jgi:hypothetical protein
MMLKWKWLSEPVVNPKLVLFSILNFMFILISSHRHIRYQKHRSERETPQHRKEYELKIVKS